MQVKETCPQCKKEVSKSNYSRHIKNVHGIIKQSYTKSLIQKCPICEVKLLENNWKGHYTLKHMKQGEPYLTLKQYFQLNPTKKPLKDIIKTQQEVNGFTKITYTSKKQINQYYKAPRLTSMSKYPVTDEKIYEKFRSKITNYYSKKVLKSQVQIFQKVMGIPYVVYFIIIGQLNLRGIMVTHYIMQKYIFKIFPESQYYIFFQNNYPVVSVQDLRLNQNHYARNVVEKLFTSQFLQQLDTGYVLNNFGVHMFFCLTNDGKYRLLSDKWIDCLIRNASYLYMKINGYFINWQYLPLIENNIIVSNIILWRSIIRNKVSWDRFAPPSMDKIGIIEPQKQYMRTDDGFKNIFQFTQWLQYKLEEWRFDNSIINYQYQQTIQALKQKQANKTSKKEKNSYQQQIKTLQQMHSLDKSYYSKIGSQHIESIDSDESIEIQIQHPDPIIALEQRRQKRRLLLIKNHKLIANQCRKLKKNQRTKPLIHYVKRRPRKLSLIQQVQSNQFIEVQNQQQGTRQNQEINQVDQIDCNDSQIIEVPFSLGRNTVAKIQMSIRERKRQLQQIRISTQDYEFKCWSKIRKARFSKIRKLRKLQLKKK